MNSAEKVKEIQQKNTEGDSSVSYLKKICEAIQHDIVSITDMINSKKIPQLTQQTLDRHLTNIRQSICRTIAMRLPQVMAIEQKYQNLTISIGQELQEQKSKTKQLHTKYEDKILENDRLKMETVQMNQNYSNLNKNYEDFQSKIIQLQKQNKYLKQVTAKHDQQQCQKEQYHTHIKNSSQKLMNEVNILNNNALYYKQQKQLYQNEIKDLQKVLAQTQQCTADKQQKIVQFLADINQLQQLLQNEKQNNRLLHDELKKQVIGQQKLRQQVAMLQQQLKTVKQQQREYLNAIKQQKNKYIECKSEYILKIQEKQKQNIEHITNISTLNTQLSHKQEQILSKQLELKEYETKAIKMKTQFDNKIEKILRNKTQLQTKYNQKYHMMKKRQNDYQQKLKKYKNQNQRLYQAMEQYARQQLKLKKKLQKTTIEKQNAIRNQEQYRNKKKEFIIKTKITMQKYILKEVQELKSQLKIYKNTAKQNSDLIKTVINQTIEQICEQNRKYGHQKDIQLWKIQKDSQEYLKKTYEANNKLTAYQQNSNKIASSLLESKQALLKQNQQKQIKIQQLLCSIEAHKENYKNIVNQLEQSMKKYSKYYEQNIQAHNHNNNKLSDDIYLLKNRDNHLLQIHKNNPYGHKIYAQTLQDQINKQKHRFQSLQQQYQSLMSK